MSKENQSNQPEAGASVASGELLNREPVTVNMSQEALRKLFEETKSKDLTQSQFEREKTQRITALCEALKAVAECEQTSTYGEKNPRSQILEHLQMACNSAYGQQLYY